MRRVVTDVANIVMVAVAVGGLVAVFVLPGNAAAKTAIGLGVLAASLGAASFATSPDWDDVAADIKRIREEAERAPTRMHPIAEPTESENAKQPALLLVAVASVLCFFWRRRRG